MPPLPKLSEGKRLVRGIEIHRQVDIHHLPDADGHVTIAAEVKVDLDGIGKAGENGICRVQVGHIRKAPICCAAEYIGDQNLLGKTHDKHIDALGKIVPVEFLFGNVQKLGDQLIVGHNGACDQLREIGHERCILQEFILGNFAVIGIDHIRNLLEGEETDTQWQHDILQWEVRVRKPVQVLKEKVKIFEIEQDAEVQQYCQDHFSLAQTWLACFCHQPGKQIVQNDRSENDDQIAGVEISIEPQGHAQQKCLCKGIPLQMIQTEISDKTQRQKYQNKYVGIKKQPKTALPEM